MRLSDAIRKGAKLNKQAYGYTKDRDGGTCAWGAAGEAIGIEIPKGTLGCLWGTEVWRRFKAEWPWAMSASDTTSACPASKCHFQTSAVGDLIAHLNDNHRWSRESIAEWIDEYGISPEEPKVEIPVKSEYGG